MKIFVCIKYVPDTSEVEVTIEEGGLSVDESRFSFDINDADNYALEEAILLKERLGGEVVILSIGSKEAEIMLRTALAKGGDRALRIDDSNLPTHDPLLLARVLAKAIEEDGEEFDLVFTGCMASDDGMSAVGVAMASMLGIPHASMVKDLEVLENGCYRVSRELEGGLMEVIDTTTPALLTIQTGINEPRYASIRGIRKARKKELKVMTIEELGIEPEEVDERASSILLERLSIPEVVSNAVFLEGEPAQKAQRLASILEEEGVI